MTQPPSLTPRAAVKRWLDKRGVEVRETTISSYWYRLKHFVEWCDDHGIESINDLDAWTIETYDTHRRSQGLSTNALHNELETLEQCLEYLADVGLVDDSVPAAVDVPDVPKAEEADDTMLAPERGEALAAYHQSVAEPNRAATAFVVAWYTGARMGAIRGLDVGDFDAQAGVVQFRDRPDSGTRLKQGPDGERDVGLPAAARDMVERYLDGQRLPKIDDAGRQPLFASQQGRVSKGALRLWLYRTTWPCHHRECPHGRDIPSCEYRSYHQASGCPSTRSPHQIRTGAIVWMRNRGVPPHVVAERVNSTVETIKRHYDPADYRTKQSRRAEYIENLEIEANDE